MTGIDRIVIIGNSGSGKSTLAKGLAAVMQAPVFDLDAFHWTDASCRTKRDESAARRLAGDAAARERWIIEGVYGWLAAEVTPMADTLIFLDMPWPVCRAAIVRRGLRPGTDSADQAALLAWADGYATRTTPTSLVGHAALHDGFAGRKHRPRSREETNVLLERIAGEIRVRRGNA